MATFFFIELENFSKIKLIFPSFLTIKILTGKLRSVCFLLNGARGVWGGYPPQFWRIKTDNTEILSNIIPKKRDSSKFETFVFIIFSWKRNTDNILCIIFLTTISSLEFKNMLCFPYTVFTCSCCIFVVFNWHMWSMSAQSEVES